MSHMFQKVEKGSDSGPQSNGNSLQRSLSITEVFSRKFVRADRLCKSSYNLNPAYGPQAIFPSSRLMDSSKHCLAGVSKSPV